MAGLILARGDAIVAGSATGLALVSDQPLSLWGGLDPETGEVIDRHHPLSGQRLCGRVLSIPAGRGSCSASGVLLESIHAKTGPAAFLLSRSDPIIALGAILAEELYNRVVPVIVLCERDRQRIGNGDAVAVHPDGTVEIRPLAVPETDNDNPASGP